MDAFESFSTTLSNGPNLESVTQLGDVQYLYKVDASFQVSVYLWANTSHIIKRTGKMIKIGNNNAFTGLKFDTEWANI